TDRPLAQPVGKPQPQHLAYLSHRQSLAWHSHPRCVAKDWDYPWLKTCGSNDPLRRSRTAFMITGTGVHDRPESAFTIDWNECSRSTGIRVHDPPEYARAVQCWVLEPWFRNVRAATRADAR